MSRKDLFSPSGRPGGCSSSAFPLHLAESIKYISAKRFTATAEHVEHNASTSLFSPLTSQAFQQFMLSGTASPSFIWPRSFLQSQCGPLFITLLSSTLSPPLPFTRVAFTPSQTKLTERIRVMTEQFPLVCGLLHGLLTGC